jgi:TatD DNase family protein
VIVEADGEPRRPRIVDTHCHLSAYTDIDGVLARAGATGVDVVVATTRASESRALRALLGDRDGVEIGLGLHPECAGSVYESFELDVLAECLPTATWISEVGLDASIAASASTSYGAVPTLHAQVGMLEKVLDAAGPRHPYSVHSRGAEAQTIRMLIEHACTQVLLHFFTGETSQARAACDAGFVFSIHPAMLDDPAGRDLVCWLPIESILIETDGPFYDLDGVRVEPADCVSVAETIAKLRGVASDELARAAAANYARVVKTPG